LPRHLFDGEDPFTARVSMGHRSAAPAQIASPRSRPPSSSLGEVVDEKISSRVGGMLGLRA
jgi:hypothetical protein